MKVFSRLNWFTTRPSTLESQDALALNSIARDIEEFSWNTLLDDMDRFAMTFSKDEHRPS